MDVESRPCKRCEGTGRDKSEWRHGSECLCCYGSGSFPKPDLKALLDAVTTARAGRRRLRASRPERHGGRGTAEWRIGRNRAYYVWRLARFHGGADVTMPIVASVLNHDDPWIGDLDAIAEAMAKEFFGTDMAAANRWGRLLGYVDRDLPGLPESAYAGGPVVTSGEKPAEEAPELKG